jgi:class 3 adenylate cyclase
VIASAVEPVLPDLGRVSSPDGAVTLMLSDIADAAEAAERLGSDRWERLVGDHHLLVKQLVTHHDGQVIKFERDGFFASFASAHAALHAAVELQRTFTATAEGAEDHSLAVRVGLNSGFVISRPGQPLGRNVVLAARIAALAEGGDILISSTVKQYTENDPSFQFESRGEHHFKGLLGEHAVYKVNWR